MDYRDQIIRLQDEKIQSLNEEIMRLRKLLVQYGIHEDGTISAGITSDTQHNSSLHHCEQGQRIIPEVITPKHAQFFYSYFKGRKDVYMRYMFLAVGVREDKDLRSSGPLFCLVADELADISFAAAFEKLQLFLQELLKGFITRKDEICALVVDFLAALPADMKRFLDIAGLMGTYSPELGCEV